LSALGQLRRASILAISILGEVLLPNLLVEAQ